MATGYRLFKYSTSSQIKCLPTIKKIDPWKQEIVRSNNTCILLIIRKL